MTVAAKETVERSQKLMTVQDMATYLGVSAQKVYTMTASKEIPHYKIGGLVRFDYEEVRHWNATKNKVEVNR